MEIPGAANVTLYGDKTDPHCERILIALKERNVLHNFKEMPKKGEKPAWYLEVNPNGRTPAVEYDGRVITSSIVICELIDELGTSGVKLLSEDPVTRATLRLAIKEWGACEKALQAVLDASADALPKAREEAEKELKQIDKQFKEESKQEIIEPGPFFLGNKFSMAEVVIVPFLNSVRKQTKGKGVDILDCAPKLREMLDGCKKQESVHDVLFNEQGNAEEAKAPEATEGEKLEGWDEMF